MIRLGIAFLDELLSIKDMVTYARISEERGYESVWVTEHYLFRDAFSTLGAIAQATERVGLATGVVNPYTRHPALIAMSIATIDDLSGGRAILGIGIGVPYWIKEQMSIRMEKAVVAMREAVQIIKELLTGKSVTYYGQVFTAKNMKLGFKTLRIKTPIYMAAVGQRMLQLAGEIADGIILTGGSSLNYTRHAIKNIKIGARKAGRDLSQIDVASYLVCSVSEDHKVAKDATRRLVAFLMSRPGRAELMLEEEDLDRKALNLIKQELRRGNTDKACAHVTEAMIDSVTVSGTPRECMERIQEYRYAGVTLPVIMPVGPDVLAAIDLISL